MRKLFLVSFFFSNLLWASGASSRRMSITGLVGVPHPVNIGLDYRLGSKLSLGITGGLLNINLKWSTGDTFKIGTQNIEGRLRFHPFSGSFFFGVAGGVQSVTGDTTRSISSSGITVDVAAHGEISNSYLIPHLGWIRVAGNGFTIGFEAGVYVPFSPKTDISLTSTNPLVSLVTSTAEYTSLRNDVTKFGNDIGSMSLPFITVLRLGWTF